MLINKSFVVLENVKQTRNKCVFKFWPKTDIGIVESFEQLKCKPHNINRRREFHEEVNNLCHDWIQSLFLLNDLALKFNLVLLSFSCFLFIFVHQHIKLCVKHNLIYKVLDLLHKLWKVRVFLHYPEVQTSQHTFNQWQTFCNKYIQLVLVVPALCKERVQLLNPRNLFFQNPAI